MARNKATYGNKKWRKKRGKRDTKPYNRNVYKQQQRKQ